MQPIRSASRRAGRLSVPEILGLVPLGAAWRDTILALRGDEHTPPSRFDRTSLRILDPLLSARLWLGRRPMGRHAPVYNLFNHTPTAEADGWSVRKTQVRDFRGGELTYDSHNGTDLALPPGTLLVAPAPARVALVAREFNRGGLKLMLEHGEGLTTCMAHLGRVLVTEGMTVARGQPVALSGASGLNFVGSLLADPPHLHLGVWLDGVPVDPFARRGEVPLWRTGTNEPAPHDGVPDAQVPPTGYLAARVDGWIASCRDPAMRARLAAVEPLDRRAAHVIFYANYYPTRFAGRVNPCARLHARSPRLDLPLAAADYDGVWLPPPRRTL